MIREEPYQQIEKEGWTPEHDDEHYRGELAKAACAYALGRADLFPQNWSLAWWKTPRKQNGEIDRIRELEKAGALIAAEIDRLLRLAAIEGNVEHFQSDSRKM
jgi:hypothetical protein